MSLSAEQIEQNWGKYLSFLGFLGERAPEATSMAEYFGERLALAPASGRLEYHNAFPGGLVDHLLRVLANASKLAKAFGWELPRESLIVAALFHDLGKVGDLESDLYISQDSDWHREKLGEMYKHNKSISYMTVPHRSVWLCQHFGVKLTHDEFTAILLHDGQYAQENKPYAMKECKLVDVVAMADYIATKQEKSMSESP
jgi:hypothetical protein